MSFVIKAVVVRALGPAQFAFVEIRLVLLVSLVLLPAIGAFRKVCLRVRDEEAAAGLAYVCVGVTVALALALGGLMIYLDRANALSWSVVVLSLVVRAFAEPPLVFASRRERYGEGSRARALATVMSGLGQTVMVALVRGDKWGKPASATGHLFYSIALGLGMWVACGPQKLPPIRGGVTSKVRKEDLAMVGVRMGQAGLKFLLENAEGFVLDFLCSDVVKGAYKLAGNFASIVARFFSEAVEEQSFNVFHRLAPAFRGRVDGIRAKDMRETCVRTWTMALKAGIMVSVLIAVVGPAYSYAVLRLLYGGRWADETPAVGLLNLYFVYLVFMAWNGVSEAFVSAAASTAELKMQAKFTTILSVVYMAILVYGARLYEASGIIAVNCMNMFVRTCYSLWFYGKLTGRSIGSLTAALPHPGVLLTLMCARVVAFRSEQLFIRGAEMLEEKVLLGRIIMHGMSGLVTVGMFVVAVLVFDRGFVRDLKALRSHQD